MAFAMSYGADAKTGVAVEPVATRQAGKKAAAPRRVRKDRQPAQELPAQEREIGADGHDDVQVATADQPVSAET